MLQILDGLPDGLLEAGTADLAEILGGPTLVHLPGAARRPLFVSTLLHGNETTGWEALRDLLLHYQGRELPRPLTVFIGNVRAAKAHLRHLDGQPDYNRIWSSSPKPEWAMARKVLDEISTLQPLACLDIHNTSGDNPVYACVHRLDETSLKLARAFSPINVYVTHPDTLLSVACSNLAPALTLECGKPGQGKVSERVRQYVQDCLELETLADLSVQSARTQLLRPVATVRVPVKVSFGFEDHQNCSDVDLCFGADLDRHNFSAVPDGTVIARIRPDSGAHLEVFDHQGSDVSHHYFRTENDVLVAASELLPTLLTRNSRIIRQDCLCYLMEPVNMPEASH